MRILVASDDAAFAGLAETLAPRPDLEPVRTGVTSDDAFALVWVADAEDTEELTRLQAGGWRVFAVSRSDLRTARVLLLAAGAEDVTDDPPTLPWIAACADIVKPPKNRRELRYVAPVPWKLRRTEGPELDGNLVNVSRGGFKVRVTDPPAVGEVLQASFAPDTGVPPLYARVLSAEMAGPGGKSGWWIRARFVALRRDEQTKLEAWLETLKREEVDPVKALVSIDAMGVPDLRDESNAFGGVRLPPLLDLERAWIAAAEGKPEAALAAITLARTRASMIATVLAGAPSLAFEPPIPKWKDEIARAQALAKDPGTISIAVGDVTAEPAAAREFTEVAQKLDAAVVGFERAVAKYTAVEERRTKDELEAASRELPGAAAASDAPKSGARAPVPGEPPVRETSAGKSGRPRTAVSIAAEALAPKHPPPASGGRGLASVPPKYLAIGGAAVLIVIAALILAFGTGGGGAPENSAAPAAFEASGVRVLEVQHLPETVAVVDESWRAVDAAKRHDAAVAIAKHARGKKKATVVIRDTDGRNVAIVAPDGRVALMGGD